MQESREEIVARVKERADIVQIISESVDLKKSGARFLGLCPFHGEKTPSFSVHGGQQFYYCFGCGESGDVFSYMMKYHNLDFPSALKELAARYSITLPEKPRTAQQEKRDRLRKQMFTINETAAGIYRNSLQKQPSSSAAAGYLSKRGISSEIQERFGLGYAPDVKKVGWEFLHGQLAEHDRAAAMELGLLVKNDRGGSYDRFRDRVLFPIYEISGRVCGFGGRIIGEGQPKYMNSPESPIYNKGKLLLGLYQQKDAIRRQNQAIVVEGNFDLISLVCHGCENVVAPLGTALTREQLRLIKRFADEVVLLFDGDDAGVKAAVRTVPHFLAEQIAGRVALLPKGHDPDTYVREHGAEAVENLVAEAETLPEFVFAQLVQQHGLTLDGKSRIVEELRPLVKSAASPLQRSVIISHFAQELKMSADQLDTMLEGPPVKVAEPEPPIPEPGDFQRHESVEPMSAAQKRLLSFMVLHPHYFKKLEEGGIRNCLAGSLGEVIFLQLKTLIEKQGVVEPEELLTLLPSGVERNLVAKMLSEAPLAEQGEKQGEADQDRFEAEAMELLEWMNISTLQRASKRILQEIAEVQVAGDFERLTALMQEKQKIDRQLQGLEF